jgi:hypothetical protein
MNHCIFASSFLQVSSDQDADSGGGDISIQWRNVGVVLTTLDHVQFHNTSGIVWGYGGRSRIFGSVMISFTKVPATMSLPWYLNTKTTITHCHWRGIDMESRAASGQLLVLPKLTKYESGVDRW